MTREQARRLSEVIVAFGEGKAVQHRPRNGEDSGWQTLPPGGGMWNLDLDWRVQPTAHVLYVGKSSDGGYHPKNARADIGCAIRAAARDSCSGYQCMDVRKYVEVTD